MKFKLLNEGPEKTYAVVLEKNDEAMESLTRFAIQENLTACRFTAIGAFGEATLGFYDFSIKDYVHIEVREQTEVLSVTGDISLYRDKPQVHAHAVLGKKDGTAHGGHLLKGVVHPTLEVILTESPSWMTRQMDPDSGIPLISL